MAMSNLFIQYILMFQISFGAKEERYSDELDGLRDLVRRLKRMTTKEGANFEYLKNVVLNYMLRC